MERITLAKAKKIIRFFRDTPVVVAIFQTDENEIVFRGKFKDIPDELQQNYLLDVVTGFVFEDDNSMPEGGLYITLRQKEE